jgi:hypothetical protein
MTTKIFLTPCILIILFFVIFLYAKRKLKIKQLNNKIYMLEIKIFDYDIQIVKLKNKVSVLEQNRELMYETY